MRKHGEFPRGEAPKQANKAGTKSPARMSIGTLGLMRIAESPRNPLIDVQR